MSLEAIHLEIHKRQGRIQSLYSEYQRLYAELNDVYAAEAMSGHQLNGSSSIPPRLQGIRAEVESLQSEIEDLAEKGREEAAVSQTGRLNPLEVLEVATLMHVDGEVRNDKLQVLIQQLRQVIGGELPIVSPGSSADEHTMKHVSRHSDDRPGTSIPPARVAPDTSIDTARLEPQGTRAVPHHQGNLRHVHPTIRESISGFNDVRAGSSRARAIAVLIKACAEMTRRGCITHRNAGWRQIPLECEINRDLRRLENLLSDPISPDEAEALRAVVGQRHDVPSVVDWLLTRFRHSWSEYAQRLEGTRMSGTTLRRARTPSL